MVKMVIQNIKSSPIQKETVELTGGTYNIVSPQNFQPKSQLTVGDTIYLYYEKPFRVVKDRNNLINILPSQGRGWKEAADHTGKAPDHKKAATRAGLKTTLRKPMQKTESPEEVAARHIRDAPNRDWKKGYRIRSVRNISINEGGKVYNGRYILLEWLTPSDNFVGAYIINVPEIYMDEAHPVLFYGYQNDTWDTKEETLFQKAKGMVRQHIEYKKCSSCGSYRPPQTTSRRAGRELTYVTSICKDCGHKEVEPYD